MRKTFWISMRRMKVAEFQRTIRHISSTGQNWHDIYLKLGQVQKQCVASIMKTLAPVFFVYLLVSTFGENGSVRIELGNVSAEVPVSFAAAVASFSLLIATTYLNHLAVVISTKTSIATRVRLRNFSANAYSAYYEEGDNSLSIPQILNPFFKPAFPIYGLVSWLLLLAIATMIVSFFGLGVFLFLAQLEILLGNSTNFVDFIVAALGLFNLLVALTLFLTFHLPLPLKPNSFMIRWGFLAGLHPMGMHPRSAAWLEKDEA